MKSAFFASVLFMATLTACSSKPILEKIRAPSSSSSKNEEFAVAMRFPQKAVIDFREECIIPQGTRLTYSVKSVDPESPVLHYGFEQLEADRKLECRTTDLQCLARNSSICSISFTAQFSKAQMDCHTKGICPAAAVGKVMGEADHYSCRKMGYAVGSGEAPMYIVEFENEKGQWVTYRDHVSADYVDRVEMECYNLHYENK